MNSDREGITFSHSQECEYVLCTTAANQYHARTMALTDWSDEILIAELSDEPAFSEVMESLRRRLENASNTQNIPHVILNMQRVSMLNSSNIAQLLTVRKKLTLANRKMRICAIHDPVWSIMLTTGLDALFNFTEDVSTSLASLQMS